MILARRTVLQRLCAFGREQVRQGAHLHRIRQSLAAGGERLLLSQRHLRGLAGADEAPRDQVRQRIEQRREDRAFLLLRAPAQGLPRQVEQRRQRAQGGMQEHESGEQQQQHQVERQVDPVRRPEDGHRTLVVASKQRDRDRHAEQGQ